MLSRTALTALAICSTSLALAESYVAIDMSHPGYTSSCFIYGSTATTQVGFLMKEPGVTYMARWSDTPGSFVLLHNAASAFSTSRFNATSGSYHVGEGLVGSAIHALRYQDSSGAIVDINPPGYVSSSAADVVTGPRIGGQATIGGAAHAYYWPGLSATGVDLHPSGHSYSLVTALSTTQQFGSAALAGNRRACRWSGTAASFISMHPSAYVSSEVAATNGTQHVGSGKLSASPGLSRAIMWPTSGVVVTNLHPSAHSESFARDTNGTLQVGFIKTTGGLYKAVCWNGTAASMVDLNALLAPLGSGFGTNSYAMTIDSAGDIAGYAFNTVTGRNHPILWRRIP